MIHIEFLVEERSAKEMLEQVLPRIIGDRATFAIHPFQGKKNLLQQLPIRLKGYRRSNSDTLRIVVLVDADRDDCRELKAKMEHIAHEAGMTTKSVADPGTPFQVLNRLAIEELEAWFFGDVEAMRMVYPRVSKNLERQSRYRDPDAITGGTWEALQRVLQQAGYHQGGLAKIQAARDISTYMQPERNRSRSFQTFRQGVISLLSE